MNGTKQGELFLWESEVSRAGDGKALVTARRLVVECEIDEVRKMLGKVSRSTVYRLARAGLIRGYKPGMVKTRTDGRKSNAKWKFDVASVLAYRESRMAGE